MEDETVGATVEPEGMATYRLVRGLVAPAFALPVLYLVFGLASLVSETLAMPFWLLFLIAAITAGPLGLAALVICLGAGIRGKLSAEVNRKMWRLFLAALAWLAVLYSIGRS